MANYLAPDALRRLQDSSDHGVGDEVAEIAFLAAADLAVSLQSDQCRPDQLRLLQAYLMARRCTSSHSEHCPSRLLTILFGSSGPDIVARIKERVVVI